MLTHLEITADSADSARSAAIATWRAQGFTRVEAVMTTVVGDRTYRVQATVSRA